MTNFNNPEISVLMPVYNGEEFLAESISSILNQTFTNFEFIIIDDKSTDNSVETIKKYQDKRIILIENKQTEGIAKALNKGILAAKGKYIARFDCDDISFPNRLKLQHDFMEHHSNVVASGANIQYFGLSNHKGKDYPISYEEIKCSLLFGSSLAHPTVILRKEVILRNNLFYSDNFKFAEDYELWSRIADQHQIVNIPQILIKYRIHQKQASATNSPIQNKFSCDIRLINLQHLKINISEEEFKIHNILADRKFTHAYTQGIQIIKWINKLLIANKQVKYYDQKAFKKILTYQTMAFFHYSLKHNPFILIAFFKIKLSKSFILVNMIKIILNKLVFAFFAK